MKMEILLEPTSNKLLVVGFNSLVHSFRALSTLRRSSLRTASAAAKPCQGDSSEFYLITGSIYTDKRGNVSLLPYSTESEQRHIMCLCTNVYLQYPDEGGDAWSKGHTSMGSILHITRMIKRFTVADDLKESSKIIQVKGTMLKDHYLPYKDST
ncbi:hypothetical protein Tco_0169429 [Tanacetum coccineum]